MPLHPLTVHLPIGLAIVMVILLGGMLFRDAGKELRQAILLLFGIFVLSLVIATLSGRSAEADIAMTDRLQDLLRTHELLGYGAIWANGLLLIWMYLRVFKWKKGETLGFLIVYLLVTGGLLYSAHVGGTMVYEEGAGVHLSLIHQLNP